MARSDSIDAGQKRAMLAQNKNCTVTERTQNVVTGLGSPLYLDIDEAASQIYWTEDHPSGDRIRRADMVLEHI